MSDEWQRVVLNGPEDPRGCGNVHSRCAAPVSSLFERADQLNRLEQQSAKVNQLNTFSPPHLVNPTALSTSSVASSATTGRDLLPYGGITSRPLHDKSPVAPWSDSSADALVSRKNREAGINSRSQGIVAEESHDRRAPRTLAYAMPDARGCGNSCFDKAVMARTVAELQKENAALRQASKYAKV